MSEHEIRKDPAKEEYVFVTDTEGNPIKHFNKYYDFARNVDAAEAWIEENKSQDNE